MKNNLIREEINVKENKIGIIKFGNSEYVSLTDLARYADEDDPRYPIQNWMRNKDVISYLVLIMKISKVSNSTRLKMKQGVINLKFLYKNG